MKLCKDCRWANSKGKIHPLWLCTHPTSVIKGRLNLVTGEKGPDRQAICELVREWEHDVDGNEWCGPPGRFWEPRDVEISGVIGFGEALTSDDFDHG